MQYLLLVCILLLKPRFTWKVYRSLLAPPPILKVCTQSLWLCNVSLHPAIQVFMPLLMWQGNLATAVCLCRYVKRRLREVNDGRKGRRMRRGDRGSLLRQCGVGWGHPETMVISEQTTRRTEQCWFRLMQSCGKLQAVWGRVRPQLLDSSVPLPPVFRPGSSTQRVRSRGSGPKRRNPAVTSQSSGHLPRRPVREFLLPGQWNEGRGESVGVCFVEFSLFEK